MDSSFEARNASLEHLYELSRLNAEEISQEIDDIRQLTKSTHESRFRLIAKRAMRLIYLDDERRSLDCQIGQLLSYNSDEDMDA